MDAPERIWAENFTATYRLAGPSKRWPDLTEYVRADLYTRLAAENERLRADRDEAEKAIRAIAFLRPLGPTRNKLVEQMERIAVNAMDALSAGRSALEKRDE